MVDGLEHFLMHFQGFESHLLRGHSSESLFI